MNFFVKAQNLINKLMKKSLIMSKIYTLMHRILMKQVVLKNNNHIEDYEYESISNTLIKNNIYLGKVSRIDLPCKQRLLTLEEKDMDFYHLMIFSQIITNFH